VDELSGIELREAILSRGHWEVVIRPTAFDPEHVQDFGELLPIVQRASVSLRGWDFPHVEYDRRHTQSEMDWIGQDIDYGFHREIWRIAQSGQFVHLGAMWSDWGERSPGWVPRNIEPNSSLGVMDAVYRFTEIYEFAARLALSPAGYDSMVVSVTIGNLQGRKLWMEDSRRWLTGDYRTSLGTFKHPLPEGRPIDRAQLIGSPRPLALAAADQLFKRFQLNVDTDTLRGMQESLGR
jgi:hypothetical protein